MIGYEKSCEHTAFCLEFGEFDHVFACENCVHVIDGEHK